MTPRRKTTRFRKSEHLETRQMLAADLGVELSTLDDLDTLTAEVASTDNGESATAVIDTEALESVVGSDVVLGWNSLFGELLVADEENQNPGYASRSMAMMNLAIYDAVTLAVGDPGDTFYDYSGAIGSTSGVSAEVAASQAAYTVLSSLYPDQSEMIEAYLDGVMANQRPSAETDASVALGAEIGATILAARADDGSDVVVDYTYGEGVGVFQADPLNPDVPVWGPGWGEVETFAIDSAESYTPETTPALTSAEYAASYNEVLELGSVDSTTRTADQTEAGIFWAYDREGLGTPIALFSDVLETIAIQQGNSLEENAALFAQASVAMAEAGIVAWQTKFSEEFWRPVTAIHDGDLDGNDLTEGDADWTALGAPDGGDDIIGFTPQFPTYISGHATFGGALFGALQEFYGTDDISFELSSQELEILMEDPELQAAYGLSLDDSTRSFDSFSEAMAENGRSRVYLGIHFDFDDLVGQEVGQAVASTVASNFVVAESENDEGDRDRGPRPEFRPGRGDRLTVRGRMSQGPTTDLGPDGMMGDAAPRPSLADQVRAGGRTSPAVGGPAPMAVAAPALSPRGDRDEVTPERPSQDPTPDRGERIDPAPNERTDSPEPLDAREIDRLRRLLANQERAEETDPVDEAFSEIGESPVTSTATPRLRRG